ncbi:MAG: GDP-L-fucose synthase [Betaproteobacteria bacterium]|nr:GDP-L-fucose synthase [Betaproteobacteria bacterium]
MSEGRIYVAGHGGLIGSAVVRALAVTGRGEPVLRTHDELELRDERAVNAFFDAARPSHVVLAAGRVGGIIANRDHPADFLAENLAIQSNVVLAAHRCGVKRLLFFASSCMYPRECAQPMKEDALLTGVPEPTSMAYAVAKLAGTELCLSLNRQHGGARFVPLIPNSVYGPNDDFDPATGHVLASLMRKFHDAKLKGEKNVVLWGSGTPRREFLFADDLAQACLLLLDADLSKARSPLNIGLGTDISIAELAALVAGVVGYEGGIEWDRGKPDGAPRKLLDSARMRALGWRPSTTLADGLRRTYAWFLEQRAERQAA